MARLASLLSAEGSPKSLEAVLEKRNVLPLISFSQILQSALRVWPPDKVYQEFAPLLEPKKGRGRDKADEIQYVVQASRWNDDSESEILEDNELDSEESERLKKVEWDPRWLDAAIKADRQVIVGCLAKPGHKATIAYLLKQLSAKNQAQTGFLI